MSLILISDEEAELVGMILDWWIEGYDDAKQQTIEDRTIETPEELLGLMATYDVDKKVAEQLQSRLQSLFPQEVT